MAEPDRYVGDDGLAGPASQAREAVLREQVRVAAARHGLDAADIVDVTESIVAEAPTMHPRMVGGIIVSLLEVTHSAHSLLNSVAPQQPARVSRLAGYM